MSAVAEDAGRLTVTKLHRDEHGVWRARVTLNGTTLDVDRQFGSWQADVRTRPGARSFVRQDVMPRVAAELQKRVRRMERRDDNTDDGGA